MPVTADLRMDPDKRSRPARPWRLGLFVLGAAAIGAVLGAFGVLRDLGPGPDAVSGAIYGFLLGAVLFVMSDRRSKN